MLKWGILGAAVLRGLFISAGLVAVQSFKVSLSPLAAAHRLQTYSNPRHAQLPPAQPGACTCSPAPLVFCIRDDLAYTLLKLIPSSSFLARQSLHLYYSRDRWSRSRETVVVLAALAIPSLGWPKRWPCPVPFFRFTCASALLLLCATVLRAPEGGRVHGVCVRRRFYWPLRASSSSPPTRFSQACSSPYLPGRFSLHAPWAIPIWAVRGRGETNIVDPVLCAAC